MLPGEWVRRASFWMWDYLRGSKVRKHYSDIKNIMENGEKPDVIRMQAHHLNSILKYATENVAFYKKFKAFDSIKSFPVINKNIIRENYGAIQSPEFQRASIVEMHTSGSTGTPFVVRQDKNKRNRVYAEMIYFWGKAGYQLGMRYIFFRIWTSLNRKSRLTAWAKNFIMWDIKEQSEENFESIRNRIKADRRIKMVLGYSSTLENFVNHLLACGDTPDMYHVNTIIGFGEAFPKGTHEKLKKVFDCNIVSMYSNQENGLLAQECVENKEYHINRASYYIELLKPDTDDPVHVGEPGRIVVTDLFNHAMPLIRYDTGDVGIWKKEAECGWNSQVFSSIQGTLVDFIYDTKGNMVDTGIISLNMWPFDKLLQFQFIQENAKQYVLKLNGADGYYEDGTFIDLFKDILGSDAEIVIEHVDEIPVLASGKRKCVMSKYKKENE